MGVMNKILIILGVTSLVFIVVCLVFVWNGKLLPDSLIYSYFSAIGAEGFVMGWIKTGKIKDKRKDDLNDKYIS